MSSILFYITRVGRSYFEIFVRIFLVSGKSHSTKKHEGWLREFLNIDSFAQLEKNTKGLQSVKVFSSKPHQKPNSWTGLARQGTALTFFIPSVANHQKIEGGPFNEKN